jgi:hypothetical protein
VISNIFGECNMKAQVVSTTFGTHGKSLIILLDKNHGLHNLNTKFCLCWHGILHPQATISLYVDIDYLQVVVCCQGKHTNNLLGCLPNFCKVLVIN